MSRVKQLVQVAVTDHGRAQAESHIRHPLFEAGKKGGKKKEESSSTASTSTSSYSLDGAAAAVDFS